MPARRLLLVQRSESTGRCLEAGPASYENAFYLRPTSRPTVVKSAILKKESPAPIPDALRELYSAQSTLRAAFPGWPFSLDGKLVGDIGEAIAARSFGLKRLPEGKKTHDMQTADGRLVQVKATQKARDGKAVGLGLIKTSFDFLLVIEFERDGSYELLYNGPGSFIDEARKHKKSASLSRRQLRVCQLRVSDHDRLKELSLVDSSVSAQ